MFSKIITIALVLYFATSEGDENATKVIDAEKSDAIWNGLMATWPTTISDGYFNLPITKDSAESEGWTEIEGAEQPPDTIALGYRGDFRLTLLYFKSSGDVRGAQISLPVEDLVGLPINYDDHAAIVKKLLNGVWCYTATFYISKNENGVNEIWLQHNATWYDKVPIDGDLVTSETSFLPKNCMATMGNPHYYATNSTTDCSSLYPWFLLQKDKYIVGVGFQAFGNATSTSDRTWWEFIPAAGTLLVITDPPQCLTDYTNDYGLISIHIWFIKDPINITCSDA